MSDLKENINPKVFMYHRISKDTPGMIREGDFKKHLKILELLNYTPITFEDYHLYRENKLTLPKKPVILTFDNGFLDTYEVVVPILKEFGMRAVIYVIGNRNLRYAPGEQKYTDDKLPLMNYDQILQIRDAGFEIGVHSKNHPIPTNLSKERINDEVTDSKNVIEKVLGEKVHSFAYPYGNFNQKMYSAVRNAGFKFACGVSQGPPRFGTDQFNIRRLSVTEKDGTVSFLLKLLGPYEYIEWGIEKLRNKISGDTELAEELKIPSVDYEKTFKNNAEIN